MTGRLISAAEALQWGLLNSIMPAEELLRSAHVVASSMAETDPAIAAEYLALYADNESGTLAAAAEREAERSTLWAGRAFRPELVAERADAVIKRGHSQA